jgi:hypothetical protein
MGQWVAPQHAALDYQPYLINVEYFFPVMQVNHPLLLGEAPYILRKSHSMKSDGLVKAHWLLSKTQFKEWLARPKSQVLLVDAHCKSDGIGNISPLSVLCASLASALPRSAHCIVLHHFCSGHKDLRLSPVIGPAGLLRSLIAQLIMYPGTGLSSVDCGNQETVNAIAAYDTTALCSLFGKLICRIENSRTIFCIIDSISDFETNFRGWDKELINVVQLLRLITYARRQGPPLKILLTNANKTLLLGSLVDVRAGEYVALRAGSTNKPSVSGQALDNEIQRILAAPPPG